MPRSLHHLMIISDGAPQHNELYDSARSLGADLIEWAQDHQNVDRHVRESVKDAMDQHDEEALQGEYPEGVSPQLPDAEHYTETVRDVLSDNDFDVHIEVLDIPAAGADEPVGSEATRVGS